MQSGYYTLASTLIWSTLWSVRLQGTPLHRLLAVHVLRNRFQGQHFQGQRYVCGSSKDAVRLQEAKESIITLKVTAKDANEPDYVDADNPDTVKLIINYLYYNEYKPQSIISSAEEANSVLQPSRPAAQPQYRMQFQQAYYGQAQAQSTEAAKLALTPSGYCNTLAHAKMYALGEKYGIESLKAVALDKFNEAVTYAWNQAPTIIVVFASTIKVVFNTSSDYDKNLRDLTVHAVVDHQDLLSQNADIEGIIKSIESLSYGLRKMMVSASKMEGPTCNMWGNLFPSDHNTCGAAMISCQCEGQSTAEHPGVADMGEAYTLRNGLRSTADQRTAGNTMRRKVLTMNCQELHSQANAWKGTSTPTQCDTQFSLLSVDILIP